MQEEIDQLKSNLTKAVQFGSKLEKKNKKQKKKLHEQKRELQESAKAIQQTRGTIDNLEEELTTSNRKNKEYQVKGESSRNLKEDLARKESEYSALIKKSHRLKEQIKASKNEDRDLRSQLSRKEDVIAKQLLQLSEIGNLRDICDLKTQKLLDLEKEFKLTEDRFRIQVRNSAKKEFEKFSKIQNVKKELQEELEKKELEKSERIQKLISLRNLLKSKVRGLKNDQGSINNKLYELRETQSEFFKTKIYSKIVKRLKTEQGFRKLMLIKVAKVKNEKKKLKEKVARVQNELKTSRESHEDMSVQAKDTLKNAINQYMEEKEELKKKIEEEQNEKKKFELLQIQEKKKQVTLRDKIKHLHKVVRNQKKDSVHAIEKWEEKMRKNEEEIKNLKITNSGMSTNINVSGDEVTELRKKIHLREKEHKKLVSENSKVSSKLNLKISELSDELLKTQNARRKLEETVKSDQLELTIAHDKLVEELKNESNLITNLEKEKEVEKKLKKEYSKEHFKELEEHNRVIRLKDYNKKVMMKMKRLKEEIKNLKNLAKNEKIKISNRFSEKEKNHQLELRNLKSTLSKSKHSMEMEMSGKQIKNSKGKKELELKIINLKSEIQNLQISVKNNRENQNSGGKEIGIMMAEKSELSKKILGLEKVISGLREKRSQLDVQHHDQISKLVMRIKVLRNTKSSSPSSEIKGEITVGENINQDEIEKYKETIRALKKDIVKWKKKYEAGQVELEKFEEEMDDPVQAGKFGDPPSRDCLPKFSCAIQ